MKENGEEDERSVLGADESKLVHLRVHSLVFSNLIFFFTLDGWVYTNDVWLVPANHVYSGAVTRRRRWVRRIWYNSKLSET